MRVIKILPALVLLPFAWLSSLRYTKAPQIYRYECCQRWAWRLLKVMGYHLEIVGSEYVKEIKGAYFVCNHQGTLDPALIVAACDSPLSFISKKENEKIPVLGSMSAMIGTIHFDRSTREGNVHMLRETLRYLKKERNVLIFPEGTRSKGPQMNPFKEKSLQPAVMAKAKIVPVSISRAYVLDNKVYCGRQLKIIFHPPLSYQEYKDMPADTLSDQIHEVIQSGVMV